MTGEIERAVPTPEPSEGVLALVGKSLLSLIPGVGPVAVETLTLALDTRDAERRQAFDKKLARALDEMIARFDDALTLEDIVSSDEFLAGVTRARRLAAETASEAKRDRLAAAAASNGPWMSFDRREADRFARLAEDLDDLHVWLLHYLDTHALWAKTRGYLGDAWEPDDQNPLTEILKAPFEEWWTPYARTVRELAAESLVTIPGTFDNPKRTQRPGVIAGPSWANRENAVELRAMTTPRGREFLKFLMQPVSASAEPPKAV